MWEIDDGEERRRRDREEVGGRQERSKRGKSALYTDPHSGRLPIDL